MSVMHPVRFSLLSFDPAELAITPLGLLVGRLTRTDFCHRDMH